MKTIISNILKIKIPKIKNNITHIKIVCVIIIIFLYILRIEIF